MPRCHDATIIPHPARVVHPARDAGRSPVGRTTPSTTCKIMGIILMTSSDGSRTIDTVAEAVPGAFARGSLTPCRPREDSGPPRGCAAHAGAQATGRCIFARKRWGSPLPLISAVTRAEERASRGRRARATGPVRRCNGTASLTVDNLPTDRRQVARETYPEERRS